MLITNKRLSQYFFILLVIFIGSLIAFDNLVYVKYSNFINIILWASFLLYMLIDKKETIILNKFILFYFLFVVTSAFSLFWAINFDFAFTYVSRLVIVLINLIIVYTLFKEFKIQNAILFGILLGSFFNYMIAFDVIHVSYEIHEVTGRFTGSVMNSNKLGKVMLLSIFSSLLLNLFYQNKLLYYYNYLNILLASYVIFLTVSKKNILLLALLLFFAIPWKNFDINKILRVTIVFLILILLIYSNYSLFIDIDNINNIFELLQKRMMGLQAMLEGSEGDNSSEERLFFIKEGLLVFTDNPIFGIGINNFRELFGKYAHNNYIELLVDVGIVGFVFFYSTYVLILTKIKKMEKIEAKKFLFLIVFSLLLMEMATVSYFNKLILIFLLFIYDFADSRSQTQKSTKGIK